MGGQEGAPDSGPPGSFPGFLHSSLLSRLPARKQPSPRGSFEKMGSGDRFRPGIPLSTLWVSVLGEPLCLHGGCLSVVSCSPRDKDCCSSWCCCLLGARLWVGHVPFWRFSPLIGRMALKRLHLRSGPALKRRCNALTASEVPSAPHPVVSSAAAMGEPPGFQCGLPALPPPSLSLMHFRKHYSEDGEGDRGARTFLKCPLHSFGLGPKEL